METLADRKKNRLSELQKPSNARSVLWDSVDWRVSAKGNLNKWFRDLGIGVTIFPKNGGYRFCCGDEFGKDAYKTNDEAQEAARKHFVGLV